MRDLAVRALLHRATVAARPRCCLARWRSVRARRRTTNRSACPIMSIIAPRTDRRRCARTPLQPVTSDDLVDTERPLRRRAAPGPIRTCRCDRQQANVPDDPAGDRARHDRVRRGQARRPSGAVSRSAPTSAASAPSTLTYIRGARPGIYRFTAGRLTSIERAPEPPGAAEAASASRQPAASATRRSMTARRSSQSALVAGLERCAGREPFLFGLRQRAARVRRASSPASAAFAGSRRKACRIGERRVELARSRGSAARSRLRPRRRAGATARCSARRSALPRRASPRGGFAARSRAVALSPRSRQHAAPVVVEVAVERRHLAVGDQPQPVGAGVEQMAVVRHQDHGAGIVVDRLDQRRAAVDVEMVGRLVEDEQVRAAEGREPEHQPRFLAAGQLARPACRRSAPEKPIAPARRAPSLPARPASARARGRRRCRSGSSSSSWCCAK